MDDEIDLRDIFRILWKRRLLIIGVFAIAVLMAGVISFTMPSVYRVSSIVALGNFEDPVYTTQASAKSIMLSDQFLIDILQQLPNSTINDFQKFKKSVKVESVKDSDRLIEISVETPDRREGKIAVEKMVLLYADLSENSYNKYKKILSDQLATTQERLDILNSEINQARSALQNIQKTSGSYAVESEISFSRALDRLSSMEGQRSALIDRGLDLQKQLELLRHLEVVQPTGEPASPIGPRRVLMVAISGMLGLMVGIFAAFLLEGLGGRIND
ncbi:MAG: hypothetical protein IPI63_07300 [Methanothrix sp.]|uniref:Wzz/FepE/Etk N-terminal domain-containing protein n=1 Tax=Methanothrix sp. TaxID=90426 RepID=UPI0025FA64CE|nr:Wzz/FepE/Etk N-terminal domain-containing protein [Methanothrix sp.]MBK7386527.1 hypothetical protein [Methanothrix sp.]